jgi:hypothetical protein
VIAAERQSKSYRVIGCVLPQHLMREDAANRSSNSTDCAERRATPH